MQPGQAEEAWRDDLSPSDTPTIDSFVTHAIDEIETRDVYTLTIRHAMTFPHGKGFVAGVWCGGSGGNGRVHYGTGKAAYDRALAEGGEMLTKAIEDLDRHVAEREALIAERRAQAELRAQAAPEQDGT